MPRSELTPFQLQASEWPAALPAAARPSALALRFTIRHGVASAPCSESDTLHQLADDIGTMLDSELPARVIFRAVHGRLPAIRKGA